MTLMSCCCEPAADRGASIELLDYTRELANANDKRHANSPELKAGAPVAEASQMKNVSIVEESRIDKKNENQQTVAETTKECRLSESYQIDPTRQSYDSLEVNAPNDKARFQPTPAGTETTMSAFFAQGRVSKFGHKSSRTSRKVKAPLPELGVVINVRRTVGKGDSASSSKKLKGRSDTITSIEIVRKSENDVVSKSLSTPLQQNTNPNGIRSGEVPHIEANPFDLFIVRKNLGEGAFGTVSQVECVSGKQKGSKLAMKVIMNDNILDLDMFKRELHILSKLDHPHVVMLHEYFANDICSYLFMDLCEGGDLFELLQVSKRGLPATVTPRYCWQMASGLAYIHHYKIAHRDLKPQNYMVVGTNQQQIRLIDFGLARTFDSGSMDSCVGTPSYCAPEVLSGVPYTENCDIWSLGITAIELCAGGHPFIVGREDEDGDIMIERIIKGDFVWNHGGMKDFVGKHSAAVHPEQLLTLIEPLVAVNPKDRPRARTIAEDQWLQNHRFKANVLDSGGCCNVQ